MYTKKAPRLDGLGASVCRNSSCPSISSCPSWLREGIREQRAAGADRHVLLAVHRVAHRRGIDLAADVRLPQQRTGLRVERQEVAVAAAAEHDVAGSHERAAPRDVAEPELPLVVQRRRIVGAHHADRLGLGIVIEPVSYTHLTLPTSDLV